MKIPAPRCGIDFCERCGDCMACYGNESCYAAGVNNGPHIAPGPRRTERIGLTHAE
jgi:hypothetical protein